MIDKTSSASFSSLEEEVRYLRERVKELESAHQQWMPLLCTLADYCPELVFWKDSQLNIIGYNEAVKQLLVTAGVASVVDVFGKSPSFIAEIQEVMKTGKPSAEASVESTVGTKAYTFRYKLYPYMYAPGEASGVFCIASELPKTITDPRSKKTHPAAATNRLQELTYANEQLKKVNTDLDNFIYTASHDLRSPIANLEGLVTLLSKSLENKLDDDEQTMFNMMQKAVTRFKSTINDLTQIISIDKNFAEGSEALAFDDLIEHVQTDIGQLIRESGANIHTDLQIPSIQFARKNLRSIIYNLLVNAIKYRSPERPLQIHIQTRQAGEFTVISVQDNGLGIRADQKDKLFAMFHRVHTHIQGTGIGLYVVKRIVDTNKGKIEVESEVGIGTTFHVYLIPDTDKAPKEARKSGHLRDKRE